MKNQSNQFQCPYENISCDKLDTATMTAKSQCTECNHFNGGVLFKREERQNNHIEVLRKFFTVTTAAFEMQYTISNIFGNKRNKSFMHKLHIKAKEEVFKDEPDMIVIDRFLQMIEETANMNSIDFQKKFNESKKPVLEEMNIGFITPNIESFKRFKNNNLHHKVFIIEDSAAFQDLHFDLIIKGDNWNQVNEDVIKQAYSRLIQ